MAFSSSFNCRRGVGALWFMAEVLSVPLRILIMSCTARIGHERHGPSPKPPLLNLVAAGRSMRIVNDHHVDFPRFAGEVPF